MKNLIDLKYQSYLIINFVFNNNFNIFNKLIDMNQDILILLNTIDYSLKFYNLK